MQDDQFLQARASADTHHATQINSECNVKDHLVHSRLRWHALKRLDRPIPRLIIDWVGLKRAQLQTTEDAAKSSRSRKHFKVGTSVDCSCSRNWVVNSCRLVQCQKPAWINIFLPTRGLLPHKGSSEMIYRTEGRPSGLFSICNWIWKIDNR